MISKGICENMCPESQITLRLSCKDVDILECSMSDVSKVLEPNPTIFVKKYERSTPGKVVNASDLRTVRALNKTIDHLLRVVVFETSCSLSHRCSFAFDRIRSVRTDMIIQQFNNEESCIILEKCVIFMIVAFYLLKHEESFVKQQYIDQLSSGLLELSELYSSIRLKKEKEFIPTRESMFKCYLLLFNLIVPIVNLTTFLKALPIRLFVSKDIQFAVRLNHLLNTHQYYKFLKECYSERDPIARCLLSFVVDDVRLLLFKHLTIQRFPLDIFIPTSEIFRLLGFRQELSQSALSVLSVGQFLNAEIGHHSGNESTCKKIDDALTFLGERDGEGKMFCFICSKAENEKRDQKDSKKVEIDVSGKSTEKQKEICSAYYQCADWWLDDISASVESLDRMLLQTK